MKRLSLDELAQLVSLPPRTVRYYIQRGLVSRPHGERRGAWYDQSHLDQLLQIRRWTEAGLSLERIAELLGGGALDVPEAPRRAGQVSVWSRVYLGPGLELHLDPHEAGLSPEQVRALVAAVMEELAALRRE
ncbi:helix-turn-helix domain-containing protein [Niveibacterium sp. 24ML]|uniref:MerR family transcriptional regulator n=1 Tax=Niveibacterium sp. 24ML TaxID=2985512 RepID=UPI00226E632A|nr:MerR family transcriptional regulator [Niveibacterium sp. 24ML]MCX9157789.1 helix-turn-helix domain-containing protein [Niveibacterium sp. 24ML]